MISGEQSKQTPAKHYQSAALVGLVLLLVGLSIACTQYKASSIMTVIAPEFNLTGSAASWIMSIFTFVGIFLALPAGGLAQKFGFKKLMLFSSGLIVVGGIIGLAANGFHSGYVLIFSRAVEGVALTFITTCAPIAVQKCVDPSKTGLATGLWGCWGNGGAVLAAFATPQIFELAGFSGVWIVFMVFSLVAAVVLVVLIHEPGEKSFAGTVEAAGAPSAGSPAPAPASSYRELFNKDTVLFLVGFAIMNVIMLALLGLLPTILQLPAKGFSLSESSMASTIPSLLALISTPVCGIIADKLGRTKPPLLVTFIVLGPCLAVMYTQVGMAFWAAAVILGLVGFGCVGLLINGWMQIVPKPDLMPKAMGVLTFVQCVGQFLGTFFVQMLLGADYSNYVFAGIVLCILGLIGSACIALVKMK